MLKSMTGYGKATREINNKKFTVEIKSLNSKQLDLSLRLPGLYREKEVSLRNRVAKTIERGKSDLMIYYEAAAAEKNHKVNKDLVMEYYQDLKTLAGQLDENHRPDDMLSVLMRMPEVMRTERPELDEEEWVGIVKLVDEALVEFDKFRQQEGSNLEKDILQRIENIGNLLTEIEPFEEPRVERIRERISNNLSELGQSEGHDTNRFEQELIYYMEKFDINEEKVRLRSHCQYFRETAEQKRAQGKKLGFISQEIGREINTIGSKANDADIQKLVVQMKDELEKVKEQVLNVL